MQCPLFLPSFYTRITARYPCTSEQFCYTLLGIIMSKSVLNHIIHSVLVSAVIIGNMKSHPSRRTIHFSNTEKPEI